MLVVWFNQILCHLYTVSYLPMVGNKMFSHNNIVLKDKILLLLRGIRSEYGLEILNIGIILSRNSSSGVVMRGVMVQRCQSALNSCIDLSCYSCTR